MRVLRVILCVFLSGCGVSGNPTITSEVDQPVVCYSDGCVRGKLMKGNLREFEGFFGIPFAKAPVGALRLKDPQPLSEKFEGFYDATQEKMFCAQKNYLIPNPTVMGIEDCLYLYVYRPKNLLRKSRKHLPVIAYIHGGAFFSGSAGPSFTGGDYFMDSEDVIFVAMSYRLGPLGFLSTGDESMSGNFGLKDQAMALQWVKSNIEAFGGDPGNIALMGQSAGASSVHLHMMSDWSRNLFHKAIMLSGNGNAPYAYVIKDPIDQARKFAAAAGIENSQNLSENELSNELRQVDATRLIDASDAFKVWSIDPLVISRPVVEDCRKVRGFLCDNPIRLWRNGHFNRIPVFSGFMDGDGGVRALAYFENQTLFRNLNENFDEIFPKVMEIEDLNDAEVTRKNLQAVKDKYFNGQGRLTSNSVEDLVKLYTDRSFMSPLANTIKQMLEVDARSTAYVYKFSYRGRKSYSLFYTGNPKDFGTVHCDELVYLLKSPLLFPAEFEKESNEAKFREKIVKFFTYFVAHGKPQKISGKSLPKCTTSSPNDINSSKLKCNYVDFDREFSIKEENPFDEGAIKFWNSIDDSMVAERSLDE